MTKKELKFKIHQAKVKKTCRRIRKALREYKDNNFKEASKRDKYLQKKYNISENTYLSMLKSQGYKCAICPKTQFELSYSLHVDHNHNSGKNRGLLCYRCNKFLVGRNTLETARDLYFYMLRYEG